MTLLYKFDYLYLYTGFAEHSGHK